MTAPEQLRAAGLVAVAAVFAALVGFDRSQNDKPAGVRTHALVGGSGALVVLVSGALVGRYGDASRAVHAIVTGIGFLGAGTILRDRGSGSVSGLTTAASLLTAAAVGTAVGQGLVLLGGLVTLVVLGILNVRRLLVRHGIDTESGPDDRPDYGPDEAASRPGADAAAPESPTRERVA